MEALKILAVCLVFVSASTGIGVLIVAAIQRRRARRELFRCAGIRELPKRLDEDVVEGSPAYWDETEQRITCDPARPGAKIGARSSSLELFEQPPAPPLSDAVTADVLRQLEELRAKLGKLAYGQEELRFDLDARAPRPRKPDIFDPPAAIVTREAAFDANGVHVWTIDTAARAVRASIEASDGEGIGDPDDREALEFLVGCAQRARSEHYAQYGIAEEVVRGEQPPEPVVQVSADSRDASAAGVSAFHANGFYAWTVETAAKELEDCIGAAEGYGLCDEDGAQARSALEFLLKPATRAKHTIVSTPTLDANGQPPSWWLGDTPPGKVDSLPCRHHARPSITIDQGDLENWSVTCEDCGADARLPMRVVNNHEHREAYRFQFANGSHFELCSCWAGRMMFVIDGTQRASKWRVGAQACEVPD